MISAVVSARLAGLDRIKSGFTSRFANRLPIFGASRLPRSFNGRSLSGNAVSSQLDFAWRMRNSVFIPYLAFAAFTGWARCDIEKRPAPAGRCRCVFSHRGVGDALARLERV